MEAKVDMSLDEIIAADRKVGAGRGGRGGGGGRGFARGGNRGRGGSTRGQNGVRRSYVQRGGGGGHMDGGRDRYVDARRSIPMSGPGKLLISNLDYGVSEGDLYELFSEFGHIKVATIHYDRNGMSLGSAEVSFDRKSDAVKGLKQYNGVPLDGKPMRIEIAGSERDLFQQQQSYQQPLRQTGGVGQRRNNMNGGGDYYPRRGRGIGRGGRGGGAASRNNKESVPAPSKESLDDDMDAYMNSKAAK